MSRKTVKSTPLVWAALAGMALVGTGIAGPTAPAGASAAPATGALQPEPVPGTSATVEFTDAGTAERAASLSPYLAQIVRTAQRVRTVDIRAGELDAPLTAETVAIELFDDVTLTVETTVALSEGAGVGAIASRAYTANGEDDAAIVTIIDGDVHGTFWAGTTRYGIEPLGGGRHIVFEDGRTFAEEAYPLDPDEPATGAPARPGPSAGSPAQAETVIDVMVAYDEWAKDLFGSAAAVEAEIIEMVNLTNMVYANSQVDVEVALTNAYDLNYTPNLGDHTDEWSNYLFAIRNKTDGVVDDLHTARDANGADLVPVISAVSGTCGATFSAGGTDPAEQAFFALIDGTCAVGNVTFPHELGHNVCADHEELEGANSCGFADGHGHFSVADNVNTVMVFGPGPSGCTTCTRLPYFSNPDVAFNGWTTGILGERDNARVVAVTAPDVAGYRTP